MIRICFEQLTASLYLTVIVMVQSAIGEKKGVGNEM